MVQQKFQTSKHTNPLNFFIERGGHVLENEHGWCNYYISGDLCYLENMYIYPEKRNKQNGTMLLSNLELHATEIHKCKYLSTTIALMYNNVERALQASLKRGFKFISATNDAILLRKEL